MEETSDKEIFPSQQVPVVLEEEGVRKLVPLKWGYPNPYGKGLIINARGETVDSKRIFRSSFQDKRCIVPAEAFYEWKKVEKGKEKYIFYQEGASLFSMAGLYEDFFDEGGNPFRAFVIITVPADGVVEKYHHRMPALLSPREEVPWLQDKEGLKEMLNPFKEDRISLAAERS